MKKFLLTLPILLIAGGARAQGCPVGQYQIGGQGAVACAPIPQGNSIQQQPRPTGKWIKTWGAVAGDGVDNLGVSIGKLEKNEAEQDALSKCESSSEKKCHIVSVYKNQCVSAADPSDGGTMMVARGPSIEVASKDALSECLKKNSGSECKIIYSACTDPIFKKF
ncbi:DUF4189 domain-containing protein [Xanthomonas campestris pv. plantaginis]|uniref:DUF4189 domain-containing protein n=1 Tax=Xanthomonas campestris TaxID=339 RepID=UPI002B233206|nr:DUF4189 domain-containing protein [Xanthomonas campestris]MEA9609030.1 DUF4189 domain-containing protein [Xanthomonas campestris pv. plantaginis]